LLRESPPWERACSRCSFPNAPFVPKPEKGSGHLRIGRVSVPGAGYFITICTHERRPGLAQPNMLVAMQAELTAMQSDQVLQVRAFTLMPDHLHLLLTLGERLELSRAIARLKAKLAPALKNSAIGWQAGFHDHLLRPEESLGPYFRYIHLNPYQARLTEPGTIWPYTWFRPEDWVWFETLTDDGKALPEWLAELP
jgi:putative transposase